jgi:MFS family permease
MVALLLPALGPEAFALVFVLVGFVMSGRKVGFEPYLLDLAPEDRRSVYVGINGTLNFSRVLLPALSGLLIDALGFPLTFAMTVVVMALAYLLLGAPQEPAVPSGVTRGGPAEGNNTASYPS